MTIKLPVNFSPRMVLEMVNKRIKIGRKVLTFLCKVAKMSLEKQNYRKGSKECNLPNCKAIAIMLKIRAFPKFISI
jgi:hypothetical protein